jgi:CxxC motif-containing protein (DUF1111 family)
VHSLFTLQGRSDTPTCTLKQPDFATAVRERNIVFRIPLQLFGLGLIESIQDSAIRSNMNAKLWQKRELGIAGHPNIVPNNGTISRFGWKAQNGSITIFAGEAYDVEMGIIIVITLSPLLAVKIRPAVRCTNHSISRAPSRRFTIIR